MKKLVAFCICLAILGCTPASQPAQPANKNERTPAPAAFAKPREQPPPLPETKVVKEIKVPDDRSLSVEQYVELWSCPSPDHPWSLVDLLKARQAFTSTPLLRGQKRPPLPRYESERSGDLFDRFISVRNFEAIRDKSIPVKARLDLVNAYSSSFATIYELYAMAFLQGEVGDSEMVEIAGLYLKLAAWWQELVAEALTTTPKENLEYQSHLERAEGGKKGWGLFVEMSLSVLEDKQSYRPSERLRLLGYMKKTVPTLSRGLTADSRSNLLERVRKMIDDPDQKALHDNLAELERLIQKAQSIDRAAT